MATSHLEYSDVDMEEDSLNTTLLYVPYDKAYMR